MDYIERRKRFKRRLKQALCWHDWVFVYYNDGLIHMYDECRKCGKRKNYVIK